MSRTVLLVDDDPRVLETLARGIRAAGIDVRTAPDAQAAMAALSASGAPVVLTDVHMPGMSGLELLRLLGERAPEVDVILMTGRSSASSAPPATTRTAAPAAARGCGSTTAEAGSA